MTPAIAATPEGQLAETIAEYVAVTRQQIVSLRNLRTLLTAPPEPLGQCGYEHPETCCGACDGWQCSNVATVHNLAAEQDVCLRHHRKLVQDGF
jgi:hypothetical protein